MKFRALALTLCLTVALALHSTAVTPTEDQGDNSAPVAENLTLKTYQGVGISGNFSAMDPEGDDLTFRIVERPARGDLSIDHTNSAAFYYAPYEGKKGKDSFTYVAVDKAGNVSAPAVVKIFIEKQKTSVAYSDMSGEPSHYAALRLAEEGIYVGRRMGTLYCYDPDETFSREEFLALAMAAAAVEPLDGISVTGFHDDDRISAWAKGYVSAALIEGTIQGVRSEEGRAIFNGHLPITRAEAAVIIDRLLAVGDVSTQTVQNDSIPAWACQSVANLDAVSVMAPSQALLEPATRSEVAQALCAMLDVLEQRKENSWLR